MLKNVRKIITLALVVCLFLYNSGPAAFVLAQEVTPTPQDTQSQDTGESTQQPTSETQVSEPTPTPTDTQPSDTTTDPAQEVTPTPILTPTPTPIPYWSDEYDAWQEEQERLDNEAEVREDEWDANEEDEAWIAAHGGSEVYYTSGQWQTDQELAAQAAAQQNQDPFTDSNQDPLASYNQDPLSSSQNQTNGVCANTQGETQTDPLATTTSLDSSNSASSSDINSTNVSNDNCASLSNSSDAQGISGTNTQTGNDGPVSTTTGDSSATGILGNQANINTVDSDNLGTASSEAGDSLAQGTEAENMSTDENSDNLAQANYSETLAVDNSNSAYVDNQMNVDGVSGANVVSENDGDVTLTTGDIELIANMLNILNLNITGDDFLHLIVNIFGSLNGTLDLDDIATYLGYSSDEALEIIAENEATGEDSQNSATVTSTQTTDVNNSNYAQVNNEMNVSGVSGANDVSGNDGGADVLTGRIQILANLMNFINGNFSGEKWKFIMINIFGSLTGDIILPDTKDYLGGGGNVLAENVDTGEGSTNTSSAALTQTTSVTNTNGVELTNSINAEGVSGNNQQVGNDDGSGDHTMATGGVDIATRLVNFLNFNITGDNWVFLIVNVFGKWLGKIVGFSGGEILAPGEGTFAALSVGGGSAGSLVSASNSETGEGSVNDASATSSESTDVTNTNSAKVNNQMNIEGISGENSVNGNDAGTSLQTGWVEIDANLLNIINMNVTGKSWLFVFLNVFGDFVGNLFFGAPPPPAVTQMASTQSNNSGGSGGGGAGQSNSGNATSNVAQGSQVEEYTVVGHRVAKTGSKLAIYDKNGDSFNDEEENTLSYSSSGDYLPQATDGFENDGFAGIIQGKFLVLKYIVFRIFSAFRGFISPLLANISQLKLS